MSLENLFLKEVSDKGELALTHLPKDMDQWSETIVSKIKEKLPSAKGLLMKVTFIQKNEELGTSTGALTLHDQKLNKSIYVPLITKNFKLYPLDVMIIPNKHSENKLDIIPLTQELFQESMFNSDVFDHLERPMDRIQQLYMNPQNSVVYPPNFRNVYASAQIIDAINDTIPMSERKDFMAQLKAEPSILVGYEKRANLDVLKKIASQSIDGGEVTPNETQKNKANVVMIKKDLKGNYLMNYVSDEVFDPMSEVIEPSEIRSEIDKIVENTEETLNEVNRNGEYIVFSDLTPNTSITTDASNRVKAQNIDEKPLNASLFGRYRVMDKSGVQQKGIVFPVVVDFNNKVTGSKLFFNDNKMGYQSKFSGIPTKEEPMQFINYRSPSIGMTGVFVARSENSALCTVPFTIKSVSEDADSYGCFKIIAEGFDGKKLKIKYSSANDGVESTSSALAKDFGDDGAGLRQIASVKDFYIVPRRFGFLTLPGNFSEFYDTPEGMSIKVASVLTDANPIRVIHTGYNQFSLKGPDMTKMAAALGWDSTNLSSAQSIFILTAKKCPLEKTASALKDAGEFGESKIHHSLPIVSLSDINTVTKEASYVDDYVKGLRVNLIKEASKLEETQLVDSALSLNFINSNNIDKFISFIPYFKECSHMLAQSLLASRLGMTEIPEQDAQTAMYKIVDVISGLERLKQHKSK